MPEDEGLLRPEWKAALNDALRACLEVSDHHEDAAERLENEEDRRLLAEIAVSHRRLAEALARVVRREGALPAEPDADAESVRRAVKWTREALSRETAQAVLEDRRRAEAELAEELAAAARTGLEGRPRTLVDRAQREAARSRDLLEAAARRARER